MAQAGCQCGYVVDSAGALLLEEASDRVKALVEAIGDHCQIGYHGHQNLSLGVANSILAQRAGARQIDCSVCGLGAGAGNTPTEVMTAVFERLGVDTGVDVNAILEVAGQVVAPIIERWPIMDHGSIMQGYAGVYSSFLLHAERAAERYGIPAPDLLWEAGRRGLVGGQEDMLIDIALDQVAGRKNHD
jgi:4-hydroxy 2-oxovalerate aldolase